VLADGKPPGADRGGDVDANGYGTVSRQDTYQLIEFLDPGVEALGDGVIPELRTGHRGLVS
jgi:hypothetical protein